MRNTLPVTSRDLTTFDKYLPFTLKEQTQDFKKTFWKDISLYLQNIFATAASK